MTTPDHRSRLAEWADLVGGEVPESALDADPDSLWDRSRPER